jgi:hypothetical protein
MDHFIHKLKYNDGNFPQKELDEVISRKDEMIPMLLDALDEVIGRPEILIENPNYMLHIYAMYLLAQFREEKAFSKLIDLISLPAEQVDSFLGDTLTEGLSSILYSTYDGQLFLLQKVIEDPLVNVCARGSTLDVYGKLFLDGALDRESFVCYLRMLITDIPYTPNTDLATDIQRLVIDNHLFEMINDVQTLYDEERIEEFMYGKYDDFIDYIYSYERERSLVRYIDDVIKEMHWWACFNKPNKHKKNEKALIKELERLEKLEKQSKQTKQNTPQVKKVKIGRNDPCPCGSGKKYKRCCINKPVEDVQDTQDTDESMMESEEERARWLNDYPKEECIVQEGQVLISEHYDKESIQIDKLVYLALHHRTMPIWVWVDEEKEYINKIAYLTEAKDFFLMKCKKAGITSFEEYDSWYKIHYRSKEWFLKFEELLSENEQEYSEILAELRNTLSMFS